MKNCEEILIYLKIDYIAFIHKSNIFYVYCKICLACTDIMCNKSVDMQMLESYFAASRFSDW